ncbi:bestrophin-like domain [Glycomyces salinus]|uniref:bestrophin-like domain n=1 Tax=Glycomyces salinus TaxID=980294 RepID=UPI001E3C5AF9
MTIWWQGLVFSLTVVAAACTVVWVVQRLQSPTRREQHNEIGTTLFELLTVLYAIVLAFVLITAWENRNEAGRVTYEEAGQLVEVYWAAAALPEEDRDEIREAARDYTERVIETEWDQMRHVEPVDAEGLMLLDAMHAPVADQSPDDEVGQAQVEDARDRIRAVADARSERIFQAEQGLTGAMWTVLVPGALLVFAVMLTLGTPTRLYQFVVVGLISGMVALMLFATYQLEFPYSRGGAIEPTAYLTALERFDAIDTDHGGR